jgi:hypothetical protein
VNKPKAVLISDVHYNISTLPLADAAMNAALRKAEELGVPCIVAGDLHDTKAMLRGECVAAMLNTLNSAKCQLYVLIGNHDLINEKGKAHSLEFLRSDINVISSPTEIDGIYFIPYEHDAAAIQAELKSIPKGSTIIMHTGLLSANMGHYVKDTTSLPPETFDGFRVISGHYHQAQTIKCGKTGLFSYIGNPYTLNFGEALDGPKGFQILMEDGSLEQVVLPLRRHIVLEADYQNLPNLSAYRPEDLIRVKVTGPKSELVKLEKDSFGRSNFKLDLVPTAPAVVIEPTPLHTAQDILDALIENSSETLEFKGKLKTLWRSLLSQDDN